MRKKLSKILINKRSMARLTFFLFFDVIFISLAVYLAFLLRFEGDIPVKHFSNIEGMIILALIITLTIFYFLRLYSFTWIYVSAQELISLVKAIILSFVFLTATVFIFRDHPIFLGLPRSTIFISYFLIFIFAGGIRFIKRIYLTMIPHKGKRKKERTLIVGVGDAGEQILRSILSSSTTSYLPVGFVDDAIAKQGVLIHGIKVLGKIKDIPQIVKEKKVEGLIIALPSAGSQTIRTAVENGRKADLKKIKIVPPIDEVINGQVSIGILKEVEMEDLLGRSPVVLDQNLIESFLKGKRVLITGAAGSIGSELCRQVIKFEPQCLFLLDQDETGIFNIENELKETFSSVKAFVADIRDKERIKQIFNSVLPEVVFHAAAYKHVPLMEEHPEEAVKNNILGTEVIADIALECKAERLIFISTDKAVNPSSVMGASKKIGEMICQISNQKNQTKFISVRFGNVLGSRGSVIPVFQDKIKKRETIEITHSEMQRYFMTTPEACLLVMQAGAMGRGGEVFVLDMGDPVKIIDLAKELIQLSGLEPDKDIPIVFSKPRPGEKFFEELLTAEEGTIATQNQKIFMAKLSHVDENRLQLNLQELREAAKLGDKENILKILKELIPSYNSGN
ncbi:MAG: nucleoside-diphosphate sugar epimerase/dehydratase [bacterium]